MQIDYCNSTGKTSATNFTTDVELENNGIFFIGFIIFWNIEANNVSDLAHEIIHQVGAQE